MYKTVQKTSEEGYIKACDGVYRKTLIYGKNMLMTEFKLTGGYVLPMHQHPEEQTGYLISGHIILTINGKENDILPGDSWSIPGGIEHGANLLTDSVAIEVFGPAREDYK